jgi:proteasome lid subunit RPN8/RPN11
MEAYRFILDLRTREGAPLAEIAFEPDWGPAREWAGFLALRRGADALEDLTPALGIAPRWHEGLGAPFIAGFRVAPAAAAAYPGAEFSIEYFRDLATQASAALIEAGTLKAGERFVCLVQAYARDARVQEAAPTRFTAEEVAPPLPIRESVLVDFLAGSCLAEAEVMDAWDIPVLVPEPVLAEARVLTRRAGARETGGILVGHLHRDRATPGEHSARGDLFMEVTAQIPARHTVGSSTRLTFTADTWSDVQATLALRRKGEVVGGWWHSHPVREWCKQCPLERQLTCRFRNGFLSPDDRLLHRTVFPRAYSIALLLSHQIGGEVTSALFGWRQGRIRRRGFHVLGAHGAGCAAAAGGAHSRPGSASVGGSPEN